MIGNAFVIGFFTALGWISAHKLTATTMEIVSPPQIEQKEK